MEIVKTSSLTKSYGKARGIIDLNLEINEGEFFGFIGPNGSGKSTTIRTLLGLISPTSGEAYVCGKPIAQVKEVLSDIGYMPSEAMFYSQMKVKDVLKYSAKLRKLNCDKEADILCERLNLDVNKKISELSLGNRKKVAIVCAMQHNPKLYVLDEPTSGLDPLMQKEFFDLLKERNAAGGTVFFSSHVLSEVQRNCTRAAIIREGMLVAVDTMDNLSRTNTKRVTLHGISRVPEAISCKDVISSDDMVSFIYQGDVRQLVGQLNQLPINDLTIEEPELEEIFMHYYMREEE